MKRKNTLWSLVLALVMVLGVFAPLSALANTELTPKETIGTLGSGDISTTNPGKVNVTVHKLQADSYNTDKIPAKHNGGELTKDQLKELGSNVRELDGVTFTYYKLKDAAQLETFKNNSTAYATKEKVEAEKGENDENLKPAGTITTKNGAGAKVELTDGFYWFIETPVPENVSSSYAVPFGISVPLMNTKEVKDGDNIYQPGTVYLKNVHIYPKNVTGDEPEPKKTVGNEVNMSETHNVGDVHTWFLQATVPGNIKDYETFKMNDVFFKGLTYKGNVSVYFGYDFINDGDKVPLTAGTDYILTQPAVDKKFTTDSNAQNPVVPSDETFEVKLTAEGIAKLGNNYQTIKGKAGEKPVKLYATVNTVINEDAKMGTAIPNTFDLTFKIKEQDQKTKKPGKEPKVKTGGKKFVKVAESDPNRKLAGAVFELYDGGTQVKWTDALIAANKAAIEAGKFATDKNGTPTSGTVSPKKDQPIYLLSDGSGLFEIKGLEYSEWDKPNKEDEGTTKVTHDYKIKEIKAPEGFAIIEGEITFTVDDNSYKDNAEGYPANTHDDQGNRIVKNRDLTIPQTGGMGTMIFMVAGLALMGGAFIAMRKRSAEQA